MIGIITFGSIGVTIFVTIGVDKSALLITQVKMGVKAFNQNN